MSYTLRIEHSASTSSLNIADPDSVGDASLPSLQTLRIERKINRRPSETDRAEAAVWRDAWDDVVSSIDRTNDKVFVEDPSGTDIFGGRFADWQFDGSVVSVLIDSPKRDAIDAQKSGGNDAYGPKGDDAIVTNDLLPRVGTVSAGTITQQTASIPFSEQHASPGKSITRLAKHTGSETRYTPAFELDYVDSLGSSQATTLSPSNQNVIGDIRLREKIREDVTHVTVLGRGKGTEQVEATAVAPSYQAGDRRVERVHTDKTIVESDRAQSLTDELIAEYDGAPEYVEIETELVPSLDPSLGDSHPVDLPEYSVNTDLRIIMLERIIDSAGERFRAILSNHKLTRETRGEAQTRSVDEFGSGDPGQYYAVADSEGWDAVGSGEPYQFTFYRPQNTIGEYRAKIRLESREYRLRADDASQTSQDNVEYSKVEESTTDTATLSLPLASTATTQFYRCNVPTSEIYSGIMLAVPAASSETQPVLDVNLTNATTGTDYPANNIAFQLDKATDGTRTNAYTTVWSVAPEDGDGNDFAWEISDGGNSSDAELAYTQWFLAVGKHTHDIPGTDPGINTIAGETVSNVAVDVGGTQVASGLGAPIDTTIDIAGELADGANGITITSDTLGELRATVEYEAIKNAQP